MQNSGKTNKNSLYIFIAALSFIAISSNAQQERNKTLVLSEKNGFEYEAKAGFNIGGISPLPIPVEIREIKSYIPTLSLFLEGNITKWFGEKRKWGVTTGLKLENKGMETKARVKNYSTSIIGDGGEKVSGRWTGCVRTKVLNTYLTLPVLAAYKLNNRWTIRGGMYASYMANGSFSGNVYDGYLRESDPTGPKVEFKDGRIATYDFSDELSNFAYGLQIGASWRAFKHLNVFGELSWNLNDIFKSSFKTISFDMYPIYANFGFGYVF